ncbi:class I SAM-dependent methyltransferase [Gelidibacter salicanalis]|uniref:Class I SAM-dependent methyltransferase n=1 Tax=Gelidibacter salicanalis TaxID=291193 RepID=A0A934NIN2_9FLAO|nr:class I SAM-dependent methyltransferase [Gelidibacter salicanalis]MBJ7881383.1 class I SAM-dependent methyltransferase [Gelidibacter salicanalis]
MKESKNNFWNQRYDAEDYVYGTSPNDFFKEQLTKINKGDLLLPAEGEGRNALYAAKQGWNVMAFDSSESGKQKALKLASEHKVAFNYEVKDVLSFKTNERFDVLGLIYAHFPKDIRKSANQYLLQFLKPNGTVIFEAFAKEQLANASGGPKNLDMLFSIEDIQNEFSGLEFELLQQQTIQLNEGEHHKGKAEVIRFVGRKK